MRELWLRHDFAKIWLKEDPFKKVETLTGEVFREIKSRRTLRFEFQGKHYFIKIHRGIGWREIFKDLLQFRVPILGARNEWDAINKLKSLEISTMTAVAFGVIGKNPAKQYSFIVTEEITNSKDLESFCADWKNHPPCYRLKVLLINKIAEISRTLHANGINHRDYYLCHFLMDVSLGIENVTADNLKIYLIDLHRAQIRKKTPYRWVVKDIGGLYFSALDIGLSRKDILRFMKAYSQKSLRKTLFEDKSFWLDIENTAIALYKKEYSHLPEFTFQKTASEVSP